MQRVKRSTAVAVMPAPPAGGTAGYFAKPDPAGGIAASVPGYEWYNNVQEELCGVIEWAGIVLSDTDRTQLRQALLAKFATLASPVFTGAPTAPTPAQFDNSQKLPTTAFVQQALGNFAGTSIVTVAGTLAASNVGKAIDVGFSSAGQTLALPAANTVPPGAAYYITNQGQPYTLARSGSDIFTVDGSTFTSTVVNTGGTVFAISNGTTAWWISGTGVLGKLGDFAASLAASGWRKLPSGDIEQWGLQSIAGSTTGTFSFPATFTTACYSINASFGVPAGGTVNAAFISNAQYQLQNTYTGTQTAYWRAIGK